MSNDIIDDLKAELDRRPAAFTDGLAASGGPSLDAPSGPSPEFAGHFSEEVVMALTADLIFITRLAKQVADLAQDVADLRETVRGLGSGGV